MADRRRLVVMRHAKAEQHAETDHARALNPRGRRDAAAAGALLAERAEVIELAVLSTAQRVRDTFATLCDGYGRVPPERFDGTIYTGGADELLEVVNTVDDSVRGLLVVGHNPVVEQLCAQLDDGEGADAVREAVQAGVPTAAFASFDVACRWDEIGAARLRLTHFDVPRG